MFLSQTDVLSQFGLFLFDGYSITIELIRLSLFKDKEPSRAMLTLKSLFIVFFWSIHSWSTQERLAQRRPIRRPLLPLISSNFFFRNFRIRMYIEMNQSYNHGQDVALRCGFSSHRGHPDAQCRFRSFKCRDGKFKFNDFYNLW